MATFIASIIETNNETPNAITKKLMCQGTTQQSSILDRQDRGWYSARRPTFTAWG